MSRGALPFRDVGTHWEAYEKGAHKAGLTPDRRNWLVSRDIHVAETTEQARKEALTQGMTRSYEEYFLPLLRHAPNGLDQMKADPDMPDEDVTVDYLMNNNWIVGDPDHCINRIRDLYGSTGGFGTLLQLTHDWDDPRTGHRSMELFYGARGSGTQRAIASAVLDHWLKRSLGRKPAVDGQIAAGDEGGLVRGQVQRSIGDIFRSGYSSQYGSGYAGCPGLRIGSCFPQHGCVYRAGMYGVGPNTVLTVLDSCTLGE